MLTSTMRTLIVIVFTLTFSFLTSTKSFAFDENSESLKFIPSDSPLVIGIDIDQINKYKNNLEKSWRPADVVRFNDAFDSLAFMFTEEFGKPDPFIFWNQLDSVQLAAMSKSGEDCVGVMTAKNDRSLTLMVDYLIAYLLEKKLNDTVSEIKSALNRYYEEEIEIDGKMTPRYSYPQDISDLVEFGYLDKIPVNPFTGEPFTFKDRFDKPFGHITYKAGYMIGWDNEIQRTDSPDDRSSYVLEINHIHGTSLESVWQVEYTPFDNVEANLRKLERLHNFDALGFGFESYNGWHIITPPDSDFAFSFSEKFLLIGKNPKGLKNSIDTSASGNNFTWHTPDDWNTDYAFIRQEANIKDFADTIKANIKMYTPEDSGEAEKSFSIIDKIGLDAIKRQHDMCSIELGDIHSVRRLEFSGDAQDSLLGKLLRRKPADLMTAKSGPFDLIGEFALANPGENMSDIMDFAMKEIAPIAMEEAGMSGMDPSMMLNMLGIGNFKDMGMDELYILATNSTDRGDNEFYPGIIMIMKTSNPDLGYIDVQLIDSLSFILPDFPLVMSESDNEFSRTWTLPESGLPLSPTVAWTDGWIVKSLFKEDALKAINALENNRMFGKTASGPVSGRLELNRKNLMYGISDVLYLCPETDIKLTSSVFSLAGLLSDDKERLSIRWFSTENYAETNCSFSLDLFEDLLPILSTIALSF